MKTEKSLAGGDKITKNYGIELDRLDENIKCLIAVSGESQRP